MKRIGFFLLVLIVCKADAQRLMTVDEAIATALQNNYDIQLSRNDSTLAALDYAFSKYAFYPSVNANAAYNFNNNNQRQTFSDGTNRERDGIRSNNLNASLNLNWTLFDGLRMFITRKRLGELVELGELQVKTQVVTTVTDVMRTYYSIVQQQQQLKAVEEQMQLSEERLKLARYKFEVGTGVKPDVLQAQIDYNAQRSQRLTQLTNIERLKEQLNNLLVLPANNRFAVPDSIPINTSLMLDSIQQNLPAVNPQLLLAQKNLDIANLALQERKAERFPTLSFNSAYNFNRTNNTTVVNPFQPLFNLNRGFNYGFTATIPIFNQFNNRRNIRVAEQNIQFQQLNYKRNLAFLNTNIINAYQDYDLQRQVLLLEEENIKLVRENLFIARERYRLGVTTFIEMRVAEQSLADAMNRLIQARINTKLAEIQLMQLRGDLVR
jgi:outer membrane protein TolC